MNYDLKSLKINDNIKEQLVLGLESGRMSHSIMLSGGTKRARRDTATRLACAMLCRDERKRPCMKCSVCQMIKNGSHPDVRNYERDDKKKLAAYSVETFKKMIDDAYLRPNKAEHQIFIINEMQGIGEKQQDTILKLLEEPPATTRFIITVETTVGLRSTILSRVALYALSEDAEGGRTAKTEGVYSDIASRIVSCLTAGDEYGLMVCTFGIKDKKQFLGVIEMLLPMVESSLVTSLTPGAKIRSGTLEARCSSHALAAMADVLSELSSYADSEANLNLIKTLLSMKLFDCLSI